MRRAERHRGEITRRYGCGTVLYRPAAGLDKSKRGYTVVSGKMAEWSIAAVLKTVELQGSGGSNPSLSAEDGREDVRRGAGIREATAGRFAGRLSCFMFYAVPGREGVPCLPGQ